MVWDHFQLLPFCAGLVFGCVALYFYIPEKKVIIQYPHPSTVESERKIFRDKNAVCYTYSAHEVNCDANEGTMREYPLQG
jgi:hypothetical protein